MTGVLVVPLMCAATAVCGVLTVAAVLTTVLTVAGVGRVRSAFGVSTIVRHAHSVITRRRIELPPREWRIHFRAASTSSLLTE